VVPARLDAACPALRTLSLSSCDFNVPSQDDSQQQQQQQQQQLVLRLQSLHVGNARKLSPSMLSAALASLPHLISLSLGRETADAADVLSQALSAAVGQLTHLSLDACNMDPISRVLEARDIPLAICRLRRIDMGGATLDDTGLRALMAHLPMLTHVTVGSIALQTSHADASCSWNELCITRFISCSSLTRLPLRGIRKLQVCNVQSYHWFDGGTVDALAAALAAAPGSALSCTNAPHLQFHCDASELEVLLPRWRCGAVDQARGNMWF
jgi:hypothetical protein